MVHGDELRPVREGAFHLHLGDHFRDSFHHFGAAEDAAPQIHQFGNAASVADEFEKLRRQERHRLGKVQAQAASKPLLGEEARLVKEELVDLARGQVHGMPLREKGSSPRSPGRNCRCDRIRARPSSTETAAMRTRSTSLPRRLLPSTSGERTPRGASSIRPAKASRAAASRDPARISVAKRSKRPRRSASGPCPGSSSSVSSRTSAPSIARRSRLAYLWNAQRSP